MKRINKILIIILFLVFITGCGHGNVASADGVKKCSRIGSLNDGTTTMNYEVYYEGDYVTIIHSIESVKSDKKEILDTYQEAYQNIFKAYEGLDYYDNNITRTENEVISDTTINYAKIDMDKLIEIEGLEDNVIDKDKKVKLNTWLSFAKKFGVKCD